MTWHVPRLWPGATVAVLASGPSMTQQVATLAVRSGPTIAVNNTYVLAPQAPVLYAADAEWWHPAALSFAGLKVSVALVKGVNRIRNAGVLGYSDDNDCVHTYGNSGAQAIQIAAKAGAARILLLGFDMHGLHWHPEHKAPLRQTGRETFEKWLIRYPTLATELKARGIEVLNCTPGSALKCFPFAELEDVLACSESAA